MDGTSKQYRNIDRVLFICSFGQKILYFKSSVLNYLFMGFFEKFEKNVEENKDNTVVFGLKMMAGSAGGGLAGLKAGTMVGTAVGGPIGGGIGAVVGLLVGQATGGFIGATRSNSQAALSALGTVAGLDSKK